MASHISRPYRPLTGPVSCIGFPTLDLQKVLQLGILLRRGMDEASERRKRLKALRDNSDALPLAGAHKSINPPLPTDHAHP